MRSEQRRKQKHDESRPRGMHGQVGGLPPYERGKRSAASQEARLSRAGLVRLGQQPVGADSRLAAHCLPCRFELDITDDVLANAG